MPYAFAKRHTIFATLTKVILVLAFLTEIVALLLPLKLINQIQLILTMSLINANQISMVTIDNLITTAIKDIHNKKQTANSITTNAFVNKTRNDSIQLETIKERIKLLTTPYKYTIQWSCFLSTKRKRHQISQKNL